MTIRKCERRDWVCLLCGQMGFAVTETVSGVRRGNGADVGICSFLWEEKKKRWHFRNWYVII